MVAAEISEQFPNALPLIRLKDNTGSGNIQVKKGSTKEPIINAIITN